MRPLLRSVPQIQRLAVFDAVATEGSFTRAASALQISQPAVSRHVAALEQRLGTRLFDRSRNTIRPTPDGRRLAEGVALAFEQLERTLAALAGPSGALVIAAQPAMATSWLVGNLDELAVEVGSEVLLRVFDRIGELDGTEWDAAILPGEGTWTGLAAHLLFTERVRPLASPALAATHGLGPDTPAAGLLAANLLHSDTAERPSMTWPQWFAASGVEAALPAPRVVYDRYPTLVQEALVGRGVVLGWEHLVGDLVERGLLVPVGPAVAHPEVGHHLVWRAGRDDDPRLLALRRWLTARFPGDGTVGR